MCASAQEGECQTQSMLPRVLAATARDRSELLAYRLLLLARQRVTGT